MGIKVRVRNVSLVRVLEVPIIVCFVTTLAFPQSNNAWVYCDCSKAKKLSIFDSLIIGPTETPKCSGVEEISLLDKQYSFQKEHHSAWYKIKIGECGLLSFTVFPKKNTDDYDFMLFKADSINACDLIKENLLKPIRTNIARNDSQSIGLTGLNESAKNIFETKGLHSNFSKAIDVKPGETYFLVLDNVYENGNGFTLKMGITNIQVVKIHTVDYYNKKSLKTDNFYAYEKTNGGERIEWSTTATATHALINKDFKFLRIAKKGYLSEFLLKSQMECKDNNSSVYLKKVYRDTIYLFKEIFFNKDLSLNTDASKIALVTYEEFLRQNRKVNIQISNVNSEYIKSIEDVKIAAGFLKKYLLSSRGIAETQVKVIIQTDQKPILKNQISFKVL